jgi:hypothetical protein
MILSQIGHTVVDTSKIKQWDGVRKSKAGRVLDGTTYDGVPQRNQMPVLEQAMRLAAIAEFERLCQHAETAAEPSPIPVSQGQSQSEKDADFGPSPRFKLSLDPLPPSVRRSTGPHQAPASAS